MANNKAKCRNCKTRKLRELMIIVSSGNIPYSYCDRECMIEYGMRQSGKIIAKNKEKKKTEFRERVKTDDVRNQKRLTQIAFNRLRVIEELLSFKEQGIEPTCMSCQKELGADIWSCGHLKTVGSNSALRYSKVNTWLQHLKNCNKEKSGDIEGYKKGLKLRFGEARGNEIIEFCENHERVRKWTGEELKRMRKEFSAEYRRLKGVYDDF